MTPRYETPERISPIQMAIVMHALFFRSPKETHPPTQLRPSPSGIYLLGLLCVLTAGMSDETATAQSYQLNSSDQLAQVTYSSASRITLAYDNAGNLTEMKAIGTQTEEDTDTDSLPDAWELVYFNNLAAKPTDDPNGDGHNNLWEFQHGTDPVNPDSDGDGQPNAAELLAGTDPNDGASVFKLLGVAFSAGAPETRWSSVAGKRYRLERSANLAAGFTPLMTGISATAPQNTHRDTTTAGLGPFFYRVVLE